MRVAVNGRFYGARTTGVQRFAREVVAGLVDRGVDVVVLLPADLPRDAVPPGVEVRRGRMAGRLWEQVALPAAARRAGAEVTLHPANSAPSWGGPHVVVLHDLLPRDVPGAFTPAYRTWSRLAHERAARKAAAVVTVSAEAADRLARVLGLPRGEIAVAVQGAAPLDAPADEAAVAAARDRFGLPDRYALAVGGDPRKGLDLLARVWREARPPLPLVVVGRGHDGVHTAGGRDGPGGPVRTGPVPDEVLRALYTGAAALLFPSCREGFGRPPLEALACGTRVVTAPCPSAGLLGEAVDRVERPCVDAWAGALRAVLDEPPALRAARVSAGRARAAHFTWDAAVDTALAACARAAGGVS